MVTLGPEDFQKIGGLVANLSAHRYRHPDVRKAMLHEILKHVPCKGPCSVLQLDRFFSDTQSLQGRERKGKMIGQYHVNAEKFLTIADDGEITYKPWGQLWADKMLMSMSDIEERLFRLKGKHDVYCVTREDLFPDENVWQRSMFYLLAKIANVKYLAYLWFRLSPDDLWVFCLRRVEEDKPFTDWELEFISHLGYVAFGGRESWYIPGLRKLSRQELTAFYLRTEGSTAKQAASLMGISINTYNGYLTQAKVKIERDSGKSFESMSETIVKSHQLSKPKE